MQHPLLKIISYEILKASSIATDPPLGQLSPTAAAANSWLTSPLASLRWGQGSWPCRPTPLASCHWDHQFLWGD